MKFSWNVQLQREDGDMSEVVFSSNWSPEKLEQWEQDDGRPSGSTVALAAAAMEWYKRGKNQKYNGVSAMLIKD